MMTARNSWTATLALATLGTLAAACAEPPAPEERAEATPVDTAPAPETPAAATRAALPGLFNIMIGLQGDMARISRGLWLAQFDSIAAGAESIAAHPQVHADELKVVRTALGDEIIRFKELDTRVHDLSVQLKQDAEAEDMDAVLATHTELRNGCMACHETFRDRIRSGVRDATTGAMP